MEQIYFGERIAAYRRAQGLTQEELGQRLGVTNQAVSKWEADQCCPDIMLLPALADAFGVTIDELFGRERTEPPALPAAASETAVGGLPWPDDGDLRAVCYVGHRLEDWENVPGSSERHVRVGGLHLHLSGFGRGGGESVTLRFSGSVRDIHSAFAVVCENSDVSGSIEAGDSVTCGNVGGSVSAGDGVNCGTVTGDVDAGDSVYCADVGGSVDAGDSVYCGNVGGSVSAGDSVTCGNVGGRVDADTTIWDSRGRDPMR